ncbi:MAG TPA: peptidase M16, partial [Pasteurellaceae bacterium]|nr:peptidase M16 [Pasteurellaceae bacterium]
MPYLHSNKWIRGRHYNAVTTYDSTTYMMTPPQTADLKQSLEALSQMLFHAHLTQQDLDDERKIIMEEWRSKQGVGTAMNRKRTESVRVASRYARHPIIGTPESIQSIPAEQLQQFYQTWYVPNNMQLLIVGDIEPESAVESIRVFFAGIKSKTLPLRDYYEPELTDILRVNKLQDPRSGVSQIAYILRFDESASRAQTNEGRYQRLLDRIALAALTQRLRNQQNNLLEGVNSLVVRKSDIGKTTVALGLFAGVDTTGHRQGLLQIFTEIARLKHFPITEQELIKQKEIIQAQLDNAKKHTGERDFQRWVQTMSDTILSDKPYLTQPEIAVSTQPMLDNITLNEVNQRIQGWLNAQDRIVQYQPPRATQIEDISTQTVIDLQQQA